MLEQNKTFKEYLSNLKKEELNKIIECYNKLCIIFDYPKIEESKGKKEELINSLINIKDNYFKGIIKLLDQKDFDTLTKIVKKPSEELLVNSKDLINYLKEKHIFYTLDNLSVVTDIDLKKIVSSKEVIKYVKKNNDFYKMMDGIIIAYGVIDLKYFNIITSSVDNSNLIIPKLEFYYKKDYKVLSDRIITNKLNSKKRIARYFKDTNYKSFTIKDYIKMGNNTYHHGIKSYKAFIKMLKNHYVFKNSDIEFIDKNIVIPYLYNSLNEEEKAKKNLEDTILSLFEFKGDKLRLKMLEEITEIRCEFPLWEYRGFTKKESTNEK